MASRRRHLCGDPVVGDPISRPDPWTGLRVLPAARRGSLRHVTRACHGTRVRAGQRPFSWAVADPVGHCRPGRSLNIRDYDTRHAGVSWYTRSRPSSGRWVRSPIPAPVIAVLWPTAGGWAALARTVLARRRPCRTPQEGPVDRVHGGRFWPITGWSGLWYPGKKYPPSGLPEGGS